MRAQWTIRDSIYEEVKRRAEAMGITASRLVEEYLTRGLRRDTTGVTLTTYVTESVPRLRDDAAVHHGSKRTTAQPKLGELTMDEIFEPDPHEANPPGWRADDELEDATGEAVPLTR